VLCLVQVFSVARCVSFGFFGFLLHISGLAASSASDYSTELSIISRKLSWRKGYRATAVRVWRPLAKKSTANQRYYAISY